MKKILSLVMAVILLAGPSLYALEGQANSVQGKVILVKAASNQVLISYKREGALVETISTFSINDDTEFKNVKALTELKVNDPVMISYVESTPGTFVAQSIALNQEGVAASEQALAPSAEGQTAVQ